MKNKGGRPKTPLAVLKKRGSWRAKAKEFKSAPPIVPTSEANPRPVKIRNWRQLLRSLPGYDPYRGAEEYFFDPRAAEAKINWIQQNCKHVAGPKARQWFILEPWQRAVVGNMFGWKHRKTGLRRYRRVFIEIAKKNGKSPLAATLVLALLFHEPEPGAEIYGAATKYDQTKCVFVPAWGMVNQNPDLRNKCKVFKGQAKSIEVGKPGDASYGIYRPISSDTAGVEGMNTYAAVVDELHIHDTCDMADALEKSTAARLEPLLIYITTSDYERESICNETEDYAIKVASGAIEDHAFLPVVYKADKGDNYGSIKTWRKANPNLGVSITTEYLRAQYEQARQVPRKLNGFLRYHLNIRTEQDVKWLTRGMWERCAWEVNEADLLGRRCFAGFDLATNHDIAGYALAFPPDADDPDGIHDCLWRLFLPADNIAEKERRDKVPYRLWAEQGWLTLTPGVVIDQSIIKAQFEADAAKFKITKAAFDRMGFEGLRQQFIHAGFGADHFVSFGQGFVSMAQPCLRFENMLSTGKLAHGGNPLLRWMADNVTVEEDSAGNIKPTKAKSTGRIDGIVMIIMAIGVGMETPGPMRCLYEDIDPLRIAI